MEDYYQFCLGGMDPLSSSSSFFPCVSVVPNELLFNHKMPSCLSTSSISSQAVSITNHTRGKLRYHCLPFICGFFSRIHVLFYILPNMASIACLFIPAWCGLLPKNLRFLSLPHHVTWLHWSPPHSEWCMTPSSSILCTELNSSALHTIR